MFSIVLLDCFLINLVLMIFLNVFQVGQLREVSNKANNAELKLFLEVEFGLVMDYCLLIFLFRVRKFCWGRCYTFVYVKFYLLQFFGLCILQDLRPCPPPEKTKEDILLFFKLYDPLKEEMRYFFLSLYSLKSLS